jgi:hypothetical protein
LAKHASDIARWLKSGGHLVALDLDAAEANGFLPAPIRTTMQEHIAAYFEAPGVKSPFIGVGPADVHNRDPRDLPLVSGRAKTLGDGVLAQTANGQIVFCQLAPWSFRTQQSGQQNLRKTFRKSAFLVTRLLANLGVRGQTPILSRFSTPVSAGSDASQGRWLSGLYLDKPQDWDFPYRYFRW